jgi:hypothetical protein
MGIREAPSHDEAVHRAAMHPQSRDTTDRACASGNPTMASRAKAMLMWHVGPYDLVGIGEAEITATFG